MNDNKLIDYPASFRLRRVIIRPREASSSMTTRAERFFYAGTIVQELKLGKCCSVKFRGFSSEVITIHQAVKANEQLGAINKNS